MSTPGKGIVQEQETAKNLVVVLFCVAVGSAIFVTASQGLKWSMAGMLAMVGFFGLFIVRTKYRLLLLLSAAFVLHVRLDFHLIFKESVYTQLNGLPVTIFDVVFMVLFAYWIFQSMLQHTKILFFPSVSLPFLAYIALSAISIIHTDDKTLGFCMLLLLIKGYLILLYFANNIKTKIELLWICGGLVFGIFTQAILGLLQRLTGGTLGLDLLGEGERAVRTSAVGIETISRVGGTLGDPNLLAMYMNFFLPLMLCLAFTRLAVTYRLATIVAFFLGGLVEIFTFSRGGWFALAFGLMVAFYGIFKERLKSRIKSLSAMIISLLLVTLVTATAFQEVRDRLAQSDYGSAHSRIPMMQVACRMITGNPWSGVGLNNYAVSMERYDRTRENISYTFPYPVHNAFLLIAAESGVPTLFSFVLVLLGVLTRGARFFRFQDDFLCLVGIGFLSGVLTWIVHAQVKLDFAATNTALWFSLGMILALYRMLPSDDSAVLSNFPPH